MPKGFENCVKRNGKVHTATGPSKRFKLKAGEYRRYCTIGGRTFLGHRKKKKKD